MMRLRKFRPAVLAAGITAAALAGTAPAHAYQVFDNLEINGKLFTDVTSVDNKANKAAGKTASGFHLKRAYFGAKYKVDGDTTVNLTLDQKNEDLAASDGGMFVKAANVEFAVPTGKVIMGLQATPMVPYDEDTMWGNRFVSTTFTDRNGAQTSADLGLAYKGSVLDKMIDYHVGLYNGEGYAKKTDGTGLAIAARLTVTVQDFRVGGFIHQEKDRNGTNGYDPSRKLVFVAFDHDIFHLNGQYLWADDGTTTTFDKGTGYSVTGRVGLPMPVKSELFARYDSLEKVKGNGDDTFVIAGVSFELRNGVTIAPNYTKSSPKGSQDTTTYGINAQVKF